MAKISVTIAKRVQEEQYEPYELTLSCEIEADPGKELSASYEEVHDMLEDEMDNLLEKRNEKVQEKRASYRRGQHSGRRK